ncbi:MAG: EamA family transporter [Candidatus Kerfeldbacteria bacterium]|jgi:drug/metabolite transporter (DMT)-like permease
MSIGFLLALVAGLIWSGSNVLDKLLASKLVKSLFFMMLIFSSVFFIIGIIIFLIEPVFISGNGLLFTIASGVAQLAGVFFYLKAMKTQEASRVVPLFSIGTILIVLFSAIFLGEVFSTIQYLGIFLVIGGAVLISLHGSLKSIFKSKLLGLMSMSGLFMAINAILYKYLLETYNYKQIFSHVSMSAGLIGIIVLTILYIFIKEKLEKVSLKHILLNSFSNTLGVIGELIYVIALSMWYLALVETIASLQFVFIFLWSLLLSRFKPELMTEKINQKIFIQKSISIILIIVGIYLIT